MSGVALLFSGRPRRARGLPDLDLTGGLPGRFTAMVRIQFHQLMNI
jgi:hypothetical protein